jgi:hypothetical protein
MTSADPRSLQNMTFGMSRRTRVMLRMPPT